MMEQKEKEKVWFHPGCDSMHTHTPSNLDFNSWGCSQRDHTKNNFTYGPSKKEEERKSTCSQTF